MQLARTAATLKGNSCCVILQRRERGRERENHGNNKWVLMLFHGQQNVGLQFNIHQFEKLMQRLKSKNHNHCINQSTAI